MAEILDNSGNAGDAKSSVKITLNSKGEAQFEVKVYDGAQSVDLMDIRNLAISEFEMLVNYFKDATANSSGVVAAGKAA